jgi:hypothetical protein
MEPIQEFDAKLFSRLNLLGIQRCNITAIILGLIDVYCRYECGCGQEM